MALGLLERAIGYTRGCLLGVHDGVLHAATPCAGWDLADLLMHMSDSLAALREAALAGEVDGGERASGRAATPDDAERLVTTLRRQACQLLGEWSARPTQSATAGFAGTGAVVLVGGRPLPAYLLMSTGAIEIAVHGWDVSASCGAPRPLPEPLARALLPVARAVVTEQDRGRRFRPALPLDTEVDASRRLLSFVGRDPDLWAV